MIFLSEGFKTRVTRIKHRVWQLKKTRPNFFFTKKFIFCLEELSRRQNIPSNLCSVSKGGNVFFILMKHSVGRVGCNIV